MECQQKLNTTTGTINFKIITVQIAHKSVQQTLHSLRMLSEEKLRNTLLQPEKMSAVETGSDKG